VLFAAPTLVRVVRGVDVSVREKERGDEGTKAANEREVHGLCHFVVPEMETWSHEAWTLTCIN
jgi:hypothetical protein